MDITIIMTTYNRARMLRKALESLLRQDTHGQFSYEILVVDDGSTDHTATVVQDVSHTASGVAITYVYQENAGHCNALNTGVEKARGNWLAFFDDDQWAEPLWLAELYRAAQERQADCVGGGAVCLDLPESAPLELGPRARQLLNERTPGQKIRGRAVKDYMASGNVLIRRAVFNRVGSFDPIFQRGCDTDFFWRVEKAGFRLGYVPQARIHHMIPESRLQLAYFRHLCLLQGVATARICWQYHGTLGLVRSNLWRVSIALGRDLPLLAIAVLSRHYPLVLDSLISLGYTLAFMRGSLFFLAPRLFPQKGFLTAFGFTIQDKRPIGRWNDYPLGK
jgi:GT2 family glycosyltransferase